MSIDINLLGGWEKSSHRRVTEGFFVDGGMKTKGVKVNFVFFSNRSII